MAGIDQTIGDRGDDVIGLPTGQVDRRDPDRIEHLAYQAHLLAQDVGGGFPLCLVERLRLVPERRLGTVECNEHTVGRVVLEHVDQHGREAEHRVGDLPAGGGHVGREREERAVRERVAVDDEIGAHRRTSVGAGSK